MLYWYSAEHYEQTFKKVGFTDFKWVDMTLSEEATDLDHWRDFLDNCTLIMYEAKRPMEP